jgi:hypothetical protein
VKKRSFRPSEYSVPLLDRPCYRRRSSSYGIGCSSRVSHPLKYHRDWFGDPALPLTLASAVRFFLSGFCRLPVKVADQLLSSSFTFPLEYYPTAPTRPVATGQVLSWALTPYSTCGIADPLHADLPVRYGPPSGFGYPLDGFRPALPCRFSFTPAALLGFTLRRFPLLKGIHGVSAGKHPHTVSLAVFPPP